MQNRNKKPSRRVDVREPLEKLSLLNLKKPDRQGSPAEIPGLPAGKTDRDRTAARPEKWM
jgi:hypothetical protein